MAERNPRFGLCIGVEGVSMAWRADDGSVTAEERLVNAEHPLRDQLTDLLARAGHVGEITVVIERPLAHLRTVLLPSMPRETAERVLARDHERYVLSDPRESYAVTAQSRVPGEWSAAFAPSALIERFDTVSAVSMTFATVDDILISAAHRHGARHEVVVVCDSAGPTDVALGENGVPRAGRRMLAGSSTEDVLAWMREQGAIRADVAIYGHAARANELAEACRGAGASARIVPVRGAGIAATRSLLSAVALTATPVLPLHRTSDRERANRRSTTTTRWLAVAAGVSLLLGLLLEQAVTSRHLRQVKERRAAIAGKVAQALRTRDSLQRQSDIVIALSEREAHASRDGGVLAAIALALPRNASLTSLQISGDTVSLEGESRDGAAVYDALRSLPALEHVTLAAPLRQERGVAVGDVSVGHFAFSARLREGSR